jgi:hypothetical protein
VNNINNLFKICGQSCKTFFIPSYSYVSVITRVVTRVPEQVREERVEWRRLSGGERGPN